jgi:hypothetical protein
LFPDRGRRSRGACRSAPSAVYGHFKRSGRTPRLENYLTTPRVATMPAVDRRIVVVDIDEGASRDGGVTR